MQWLVQGRKAEADSVQVWRQHVLKCLSKVADEPGRTMLPTVIGKPSQVPEMLVPDLTAGAHPQHPVPEVTKHRYETGANNRVVSQTLLATCI